MIVDSQIDLNSLEHFYKVRWKGWSSKDDPLEPKKNMTKYCSAIEQFEREAEKIKRKYAVE